MHLRELFICTYPQPLSKFLKWIHPAIHILDAIVPELPGARYSTKVYLVSAFWHLELDKVAS